MYGQGTFSFSKVFFFRVGILVTNLCHSFDDVFCFHKIYSLIIGKVHSNSLWKYYFGWNSGDFRKVTCFSITIYLGWIFFWKYILYVYVDCSEKKLHLPTCWCKVIKQIIEFSYYKYKHTFNSCSLRCHQQLDLFQTESDNQT